MIYSVKYTLRTYDILVYKTLSYFILPTALRQIAPFYRGGSIHREVTWLTFKSTKLALNARFSDSKFRAVLCPHRVLLGLQFGVTVTPYSRLLVSGGHIQGGQYHTGSRAPALLTAAQEPWKNWVGEEPRGYPTFLLITQWSGEKSRTRWRCFCTLGPVTQVGSSS